MTPDETCPVSVLHTRVMVNCGDHAQDITAALCDAGRLSEGAPSEEQIERGAKALFAREQCGEWDDFHKITQDRYRDTARAALTAAGVAPQASTGLTPAELASRTGDGSCSNPECPLTRAHMGPCAPSPNALAAQSAPDDRHWSDKAASAYPGDEYENYPLRQAFGRGHKAALAAQPVLDESKVSGQLSHHEPIFHDGQYAGRCICGHEHPSYSGWRLHRARALCEVAKRGVRAPG